MGKMKGIVAVDVADTDADRVGMSLWDTLAVGVRGGEADIDSS
jgi:hypothetical protein